MELLQVNLIVISAFEKNWYFSVYLWRWLQQRVWQLWVCQNYRQRVVVEGWGPWVSPLTSYACSCSRWVNGCCVCGSYFVCRNEVPRLTLPEAEGSKLILDMTAMQYNKFSSPFSGWTCTWRRMFLHRCCCSPEPCIWLTSNQNLTSSHLFPN